MKLLKAIRVIKDHGSAGQVIALHYPISVSIKDGYLVIHDGRQRISLGLDWDWKTKWILPDPSDKIARTLKQYLIEENPALKPLIDEVASLGAHQWVVKLRSRDSFLIEFDPIAKQITYIGSEDVVCGPETEMTCVGEGEEACAEAGGIRTYRDLFQEFERRYPKESSRIKEWRPAGIYEVIGYTEVGDQVRIYYDTEADCFSGTY